MFKKQLWHYNSDDTKVYIDELLHIETCLVLYKQQSLVCVSMSCKSLKTALVWPVKTDKTTEWLIWVIAGQTIIS